MQREEITGISGINKNSEKRFFREVGLLSSFQMKLGMCQPPCQRCGPGQAEWSTFLSVKEGIREMKRMRALWHGGHSKDTKSPEVEMLPQVTGNAGRKPTTTGGLRGSL